MARRVQLTTEHVRRPSNFAIKTIGSQAAEEREARRKAQWDNFFDKWENQPNTTVGPPTTTTSSSSSKRQPLPSRIPVRVKMPPPRRVVAEAKRHRSRCVKTPVLVTVKAHKRIVHKCVKKNKWPLMWPTCISLTFNLWRHCGQTHG